MMTKEEITKKIAECEKTIAEKKSAIEATMTLYDTNAANGANDLVSLKAKMDEDAKLHNRAAHDLEILKIMLATDDKKQRMIEVCKRLNYTAWNVKASEDKETGIMSCELQKLAKPMNLTMSVTEFGADPTWYGCIQKLGYYQLCNIAVEVMDDPNVDVKYSTYRMNATGRKVKFGKDYTDSGAMLEALKETVTAMVGSEFGDKVTFKDEKFMTHSFSRRSKKKRLTIECIDSKEFSYVLMDIVNKIVTENKFDVESRAVKK